MDSKSCLLVLLKIISKYFQEQKELSWPVVYIDCYLNLKYCLCLLSGSKENTFSNETMLQIIRVRTGPGNPGKPWKIFEALEIPGKAQEFLCCALEKSHRTLLKR